VCCKNARLTAIRVKKGEKKEEEEKKLESKVEETQAKLMERNAFEKQSGCHSFPKKIGDKFFLKGFAGKL
jgi:hypothetical protein